MLVDGRVGSFEIHSNSQFLGEDVTQTGCFPYSFSPRVRSGNRLNIAPYWPLLSNSTPFLFTFIIHLNLFVISVGKSIGLKTNPEHSCTITMADPKPHILVLGAGISGLQTTLSLLKSGHLVTIIASHKPGDFSSSYTSPWAGGHWRSHASTSTADAALRSYDARTYEAWTQMLASAHTNLDPNRREEVEKEMGIGFRPARYY